MTTPGGENWKITVMSWPYDTHMGVSMRGRGGRWLEWIAVVLKWSQDTSFYICLQLLHMSQLLLHMKWDPSHLILLPYTFNRKTKLFFHVCPLYYLDDDVDLSAQNGSCSIYAKQLKQIFQGILWRSDESSLNNRIVALCVAIFFNMLNW